LRQSSRLAPYRQLPLAVTILEIPASSRGNWLPMIVQ
jgi:hypothetical protein